MILIPVHDRTQVAADRTQQIHLGEPQVAVGEAPFQISGQ